MAIKVNVLQAKVDEPKIGKGTHLTQNGYYYVVVEDNAKYSIVNIVTGEPWPFHGDTHKALLREVEEYLSIVDIKEITLHIVGGDSDGN